MAVPGPANEDAALESPAPLVFLIVTAAVTVWTGVLYFRRSEPKAS